MMKIYQEGCRSFGENRLEEVLEKSPKMPQDIEWHMIGTLQTKKVNKTIGRFTLIHSVDHPQLAKKISDSSLRHGVKTCILLQSNTSGEKSKQGLTPQEWKACFEDVLELEGIEVKGFMTMAPLTEDTSVIRNTFVGLRELKCSLEREIGRSFPHLSMGMSHDYPIAIEEGATLVRIGTAIFES